MASSSGLFLDPKLPRSIFKGCQLEGKHYTVNYVQYPILNHNGKEYKCILYKYMYVCNCITLLLRKN